MAARGETDSCIETIDFVHMRHGQDAIDQDVLRGALFVERGCLQQRARRFIEPGPSSINAFIDPPCMSVLASRDDDLLRVFQAHLPGHVVESLVCFDGVRSEVRFGMQCDDPGTSPVILCYQTCNRRNVWLAVANGWSRSSALPRHVSDQPARQLRNWVNGTVLPWKERLPIFHCRHETIIFTHSYTVNTAIPARHQNPCFVHLPPSHMGVFSHAIKTMACVVVAGESETPAANRRSARLRIHYSKGHICCTPWRPNVRGVTPISTRMSRTYASTPRTGSWYSISPMKRIDSLARLSLLAGTLERRVGRHDFALELGLSARLLLISQGE